MSSKRALSFSCSGSASSTADSELDDLLSQDWQPSCGSKRSRQGEEDYDDLDGSHCALSGMLNSATACPPLMHQQKRERRKRARTDEEKKQRAAERKMKNRQSAMRSRQRVLNELKTDKEEIDLLRQENVMQQRRIQALEDELKQLKDRLSQPSSSYVVNNESEVSVLDFLESLLSTNNNIQAQNLPTPVASGVNLSTGVGHGLSRSNTFDFDLSGLTSFVPTPAMFENESSLVEGERVKSASVYYETAVFGLWFSRLSGSIRQRLQTFIDNKRKISHQHCNYLSQNKFGTMDASSRQRLLALITI